MKEMESKHSPDAKLECVLRCSRYLCEALRLGTQGLGRVSADELLSATIWMVLRSNPYFLHSNIKYVTYFSAPTKLYTSEAGYYFTNLVSGTPVPYCGYYLYWQSLNEHNVVPGEETHVSVIAGTLLTLK